jgi:hypothetical protein
MNKNTFSHPSYTLQSTNRDPIAFVFANITYIVFNTKCQYSYPYVNGVLIYE